MDCGRVSTSTKHRGLEHGGMSPLFECSSQTVAIPANDAGTSRAVLTTHRIQPLRRN